MSRLGSLSPAALRAMFSPDADDTLITLLTITGQGISTPIRLASNFTKRISETEDDVMYGVTSRGHDYIFLPLEITLPTEDDAAPRAAISIHDATRYLIPIIRGISGALNVSFDLVLAQYPDIVEIVIPGMEMGAISYNADTITAELSRSSLAVEPFPAHTFTPAYFPGIF